MAGTLREGNIEEDPFWRKAILGIVTALVVATVSGVAGGYVSAQIMIRELSIKMEFVTARMKEDRDSTNAEFRELRARIRSLENRR